MVDHLEEAPSYGIKVKSAPTQATPASQWKKNWALEVPSGNVCLVRSVGLQTFVAMGVIPNSLAPLLMGTEARGVDKAILKMQGDPQTLRDYMTLVDEVTLKCVVEPVITAAPNCVECNKPADHPNHPMFKGAEGHVYVSPGRDPELFYVDEVDENDKSFIFQAVVMGGTKDVEQFRQEQKAVMASLSSSKSVPVPTEPTTGD